MEGIVNVTPQHHQAFGHHNSINNTPQHIPAEVLQAAAMSGGGAGRRNIKIRAVQKTPTEMPGNPDFLSQALQQH